MEMTYDQYIQNPMGVKNAVFSARDMYHSMYSKKWDAIRLRENGIIDFLLMKDNTDYYIYIKIPSEVVPKFYYDVVIRFYPPKDRKAIPMERTLSNYNVQFFSNDPSFVFTFAHAFKANNMLFTDLNERMARLALRKQAAERNPQDQVGYVKSLFFAYLEIKHKGLMQKIKFGTAEKYDKKKLLAMIMPADDKIEARQKEGEKIAKKQQRVKKANSQNDDFKERQKQSTGITNMVGNGIKKIGRITGISAKSKISGKSKITGKR